MRKFRIGTVAGIGIFLHWTFLLFVVGIFALAVYQGNTVGAALAWIGLILAVFACVVLHELGHALTARYYDVPTRDITIYPIGGIARLERIPEESMKEFWIALAGPLVNLALAFVLAFLILATGGALAPADVLAPGGGHFLAKLMWLNLVLFGFNLLPAFPMDGGRILRALLATRLAYPRASQIAANVGQGMAILFGLVGLVIFNPFLIFIALFVFYGARQESQQAMMRGVVRGVPVRQVMLTRFATLAPTDTLDVAVEELLAGSDQDFPVVHGGRVVGVLTRKQLMQGLAEGGRSARVKDVVEPGVYTVEDTTLLEDVFAGMSSASTATVPVLRNGVLVGLLTLENVGEFMMINSALKKGGEAPKSEPILAPHGSV